MLHGSGLRLGASNDHGVRPRKTAAQRHPLLKRILRALSTGASEAGVPDTSSGTFWDTHAADRALPPQH